MNRNRQSSAYSCSLSIRHWIRLGVLLSMLLSLGATFAWAQSTSSGTVSGQVTDQSNAAVPAAEVRLIDVETSTARTAATNEVGRYSFINVTPGVYGHYRQ